MRFRAEETNVETNERHEVPEDREWILVGCDFTAHAARALARARSLARGKDCALLVIHVIDVPDLDQIARAATTPEAPLRERIAADRRERLVAFVADTPDGAAPVPTELVVVWGRPFEEILRRARDFAVDMIVLGVARHSTDLESFLFGSTAEKVIRGAPCPVLCVPG